MEFKLRLAARPSVTGLGAFVLAAALLAGTSPQALATAFIPGDLIVSAAPMSAPHRR